MSYMRDASGRRLDGIDIPSVLETRPSRGYQSIAPPGVKIRGLNLVPSLGVNGLTGISGWAGFYTKFPWATIKKQVDLAIGAGANNIRWMGGLGAMNTIPLAEYLEKFEQVVAYAQQRGLFVTPALESYGYRLGVSDSAAVDYLLATVEMLNRYSNVLYCDVTNEILGEYAVTHNVSSADARDPAAALAQSLYTALKPATTIPLGFSHSYPPGVNLSWYAALMPWSDVIDLHVYPYSTGTIAALDIDTSILATYPNKPVFFSEYGAELNPSAPGSYLPATDYMAHFRATRTLMNRPGFDGGNLFSVVDIVPLASGGTHSTGLYANENGTGVHADVLAVFKSMPTRSRPWSHVVKLPASPGNVAITGTLLLHDTTIFCPTACTAEVELSIDVTTVAGDVTTYGFRPSVDGSTATSLEAQVTGDNAIATYKNGAGGRQAIRKTWTFDLAAGSHQFRSFVERLSGTDTTATVIYPGTLMKIKFTPA